MPIIRVCDFTGDTIETIETVGIAAPIGTVDIIEQVSDGFTIQTLHDGRQAELQLINADWEIQLAEQKIFYKQQVMQNREDFYIAEAKDYYGTFYNAEIEQAIKDYLA